MNNPQYRDSKINPRDIQQLYQPANVSKSITGNANWIRQHSGTYNNYYGRTVEELRQCRKLNQSMVGQLKEQDDGRFL